jgi:hypothetical protein
MPTKLTIGLSKKFSTLGTDGRPDYGSIGADIHLEVELDSSMIQHPDAFRDTVAQHYALARESLDEAIAELRAGQPAPHVVDMPQTIKERQAAALPAPAAANGNGNGYHGNDGAATRPAAKPAFNWDRNRNPAGGSAPRGDQRGGGKSYGPPQSGNQLFAWAKGEEEKRNARGFVKALQKIAQEQCGSWKFADLSPDQIVWLYEAGQELLDQAGN